MSIRNNKLSGSIPAELGNLSKLEWLYINNNELSGSIPTELGNLTELDTLFLSGNQLTGCIPAGLRDISDNDFDELDPPLPFCESDQQPSGAQPAMSDPMENLVPMPAKSFAR